MTYSITTLIIMTVSLTTYNIKKLSITTLSITTVNIINKTTQQNDSVVTLRKTYELATGRENKI